MPLSSKESDAALNIVHHCRVIEVPDPLLWVPSNQSEQELVHPSKPALVHEGPTHRGRPVFEDTPVSNASVGQDFFRISDGRACWLPVKEERKPP